jgi:hypothetical protein
MCNIRYCIKTNTNKWDALVFNIFTVLRFLDNVKSMKYVLLLLVLLSHKPNDITSWAVDTLFIYVCSKSTVQHMIPVKTMVKVPLMMMYRHRNMSGNKI